MDDISDKISFAFKLNKQLDIQQLHRQPWGKTLHDVDGELQIFVDDLVYFDEREVLLLEFGILLKKWIVNVRKGEISNFIYNSIEDDSPIFEFRFIEDAWEVYSDWIITEKPLILLPESLFTSCEELINELEKSLMSTYEIKIRT